MNLWQLDVLACSKINNAVELGGVTSAGKTKSIEGSSTGTKAQ